MLSRRKYPHWLEKCSDEATQCLSLTWCLTDCWAWRTQRSYPHPTPKPLIFLPVSHGDGKLKNLSRPLLSVWCQKLLYSEMENLGVTEPLCPGQVLECCDHRFHSLLIFLSCYTFTVLPARSLHSSSDTCMIKFVKIQHFNRKTHGFRTFSHFGPHIWNNLPQDIRHSATLSSFKSQLKT